MKIVMMIKTVLSPIAIFFLVLIVYNADSQETNMSWKAGVAKYDITPQSPMWMAGYRSRKTPSKGKLHPIWLKVLALEDAWGNKCILVTSDLVGWPKVLSDAIRQTVNSKYGLEKSQIILNSSHTHTGPLLQDLFTIYNLQNEELLKVSDYSNDIKSKVVELVGKAIEAMEPVTLYSGNGVARFQVNRRNNNASTLYKSSDLNGPNDYSVPVIKVMRQDKSLLAIVFGYACHPTVLNINKWSGDYPGFAQMELEKDHPGAVALFFQGAGADQNPLPRRTIPLARQYGRTLAAAVDRVMEEEMKQLESTLSTAYTEIRLDLNPPPSLQELENFCEMSTGSEKIWGETHLNKLKTGKSLIEEYPFPIQIWKLGDQIVFALGGETLVGYAIQLKEIFGYESFVMGYSNDVMGYIPTAKVLQEGGYEGATSQVTYSLPSKWSYNIETTIINNLVSLAESIKVKPSQNDWKLY